MEITKHLSIIGKVQGVWYRAWTRETATRLGLHGWVRNRLDGSVEALVRGDEEQVHNLIKECRNGPPAAHVDEIIITDSDETVPDGFKQERTV